MKDIRNATPTIIKLQSIPPNIAPNMAKPCFKATFSFCQSNFGKHKPSRIPKYAQKATIAQTAIIIAKVLRKDTSRTAARIMQEMMHAGRLIII